MALQRFKLLCSGVKNPKRRFRYTANREAEVIRISLGTLFAYVFDLVLFSVVTIEVAILNAILRVVQCFVRGLVVLVVAIWKAISGLTLIIIRVLKDLGVAICKAISVVALSFIRVIKALRVAMCKAITIVVLSTVRGLKAIRVAICDAVPRVTLIIRGLEARQSSERNEVMGHIEEEREMIRVREVLPLNEDDEHLQFDSNLSEEHWHVPANDGSGTIEHFKQLMPSAKSSVASISQPMTAILMSNLTGRRNVINATAACLCFSLFLNFVVMVRSDGTQTSRNYKAHLHFLTCGLTFILMLCALCLLLLNSANYGPLAIYPVLALIIMIIQGSKFGYAQSARNYREHDGKLKYYYDFSSDVANATFTGLLTCIFSNPTIPHQNGEVKPIEMCLYFTVVTSLLLKHLSSVPPAVSYHTEIARVMKAMKYLFYIIVGLLFLFLLLAAGAVLGGGISNLIYITGVTIFVAVTIINEKKVQAEVFELDSPAMVIVMFILEILVAVYSKYADDRTKVDDQYFLLHVFMLCSSTAFITSLSKVLLMSDCTTGRAWSQAKIIFSYVSCASAFAATVSFFLTL